MAILCLSLAACGGSPEASRDEHLKRGDDYLAAKKLQEAVVEYKGAVQDDPRSGIARQKLGNVYLQLSDPARAFTEIVKAADLLPDDMQAQIQAARVLLLVSHFDDARGRAEKVLARDPQNVDAHILKGSALAGLREFGDALNEIQEAIRTDPTRSTSYTHLGTLQHTQGDTAQAEASFKRAIATDPKSAPARLALANLYWSTNRHREAEELIAEAAKLDPANVLPNQALAMLYLGTGRTAEAEAPLKSVAEHAAGFEGKIMLADYYANVQRLDEARAIYEQVASTTPGMATAKLRLAALGLMKGDRSGAYRLVDEVLAKEPSHVEALIARAQLLAEDRKMDDALASARKAVAADPAAPLGQYVLGQILRSQYQLEEAESAFKDAVRSSPRFAPANAELAKLALQAGRFSEAIGYAQAAISAMPGYGEAYLLLARSHLANGNPAGAEAPIKVMTTNFPDSPLVQAELGRLLLAKSDLNGASAAFARALAREPLQPSALEGMIVVEVRQKRVPAARKRLDAAVAAAPKSAELQLMAAGLYEGAFSDVNAAEAAVKRALAADPANLTAYSFLAGLHIKANNLPAATAEYEQLAQRQPRSVANHTVLGVLYSLQNKPDQARASWERALQLDPRAPVAANNLAQLYVDRNENLEIALQLAQTAKAGLPRSDAVDDTLGWIHYKRGFASLAIASLKAAADAQPDNPVYLYHLGAAYALNKDKTNARQALERALKLQPGFPGADDARKILDSLKG